MPGTEHGMEAWNSACHQQVDDTLARQRAESPGASPSPESSFPVHLREDQRGRARAAATAVTRPEANYVPGAQAPLLIPLPMPLPCS